MERTVETQSADATRDLARRLAEVTLPGSRILLDGDLGAGKTTFVQGYVEGLRQLEPVRVKSPTYALCHAYPTQPKLWHADLYRLGSTAEAETLGILEGVDAEDIAIIEWAGNAPDLVEDAVQIRIVITGEESRRIQLRSSGPRSAQVLNALQ